MARHKKRSGREVNGILVLDKPPGISSNAALQQVKRIYQARKAGHTGSLDPLATGMLPICFGIVTRLSAYLLDADKHYLVQARLGQTTTTGDAEGELLQTYPVEDINQAKVVDTLASFQGVISQIPPMYSALKHQGQRLYQLAREGIEVERKPRQVTIHKIVLTQLQADTFSIQVHCTKGTYVRTLIEDIATALGTGAHVTALRRTGVGPYTRMPMHTVEQLETAAAENALDELLLPPDTALADWPAIHLNAAMSYYLKQGQPITIPKTPTEGRVRLYQAPDQFLGVGEVLPDGRVGPRCLLTG